MLLEQYPQAGGAAAAGEAGGTPGADEPEPVNARDKYGWTPLHHACYGGHADVAAALLAQGARAAKVGTDGWCWARHHTGPRAKAWCLLIHAEASLSLTGTRAKAWCLIMHAEASLSLSRSLFRERVSGSSGER